MIKKKHLILALIVLLLMGIILLLYNLIPPQGNMEGSRFLLDTVVSIKIYKFRNKQLIDEAFNRISQLENILSRYSPNSDITRFNKAEFGNSVTVSKETLTVLNLAIHYARLSRGAFDPTVGPLVDLWDIGGLNPQVPDREKIIEALPLVNYNLLRINPELGEVVSDKPGMILDTGGIAKGWIADNIINFLIENGAEHILLNLGGNVRLSGGKPGGEDFRIGMQDPYGKRGNYVGIFSLANGSVVSSGVYERYFETNGKRYHHILDTKTGWPVDNGVAAVTVISEMSVDGDALSTALFALGIDEGLKLATSLDGVEAAFITNNGTVVITPGANAIFEPTRNDLKILVR